MEKRFLENVPTFEWTSFEPRVITNIKQLGKLWIEDILEQSWINLTAKIVNFEYYIFLCQVQLLSDGIDEYDLLIFVHLFYRHLVV